MVVVREDQLVDLLGELLRIIAAERTKRFSRTRHHVTGAGSRVSPLILFLIDTTVFDDQLQRLVDLFHVRQIDSRNFESLPVRQVDHSLAVFLRDVYHTLQGFHIDLTARAPDTGSCFASHLGLTEGVLLQLLHIRI